MNVYKKIEKEFDFLNKLGSQFSIFAERIPKDRSALWEEIQYLIENNIPWSMF